MAITTYSELQASVAQEISYDCHTGAFTWLKSGRGQTKRAGSKAGCIRDDGYTLIKVNGKSWLAHRLAWVLHYGEKPPRVIDHKNMNKSDNSISNLRDGTGGVNERNVTARNKTPFGILGVRKGCAKGSFQAYTTMNKKFVQLYNGYDFFEACCARKSSDAKFWSNVK